MKILAIGRKGALVLSVALVASCAGETTRRSPPDTGAGGTAGDGGLATVPVKNIKQTSNLPVVFVTYADALKIRSGGKVPGRMKIVSDHDGTHAGLDSRPASFEGPIGVKYHGDSSQDYPQKSFNIELRTEAGTDLKLPILGLPSESDWVLVGCWADKTCMRNALAYAMGQRFGRWQPTLLFVEVFVNGEYNGLYQLVEDIKTSRVRLAEPDPAIEGTGPELSGTYIFRREFWGKGKPTDMILKDWASPVTGAGSVPILYSYAEPDADKITPPQREYLTTYVASFEEMMNGAGWKDPTTGYQDWVDVKSWVDYALMQEVSNNVDAYFKSAYYVKQRDTNERRGRLLMAPLWDFNIAFGNANYRDGWKVDNFAAWMNRYGGAACSDYVPLPAACMGDKNNCYSTEKQIAGCHNIPYLPFYWEKIWEDPKFQDAVKCRWNELRKPGGPLTAEFVDSHVQEWTGVLQKGFPRHITRWAAARRPIVANPCEGVRKDGILTEEFSDKYKQPGVPFPNCASPGAEPKAFLEYEAKWLQAWTKKRLEFLDKNLPGVCKAK